MKVLKNFRCKNTGKIILAGENFESADTKRIDFLVKKGLLGGEMPPIEATKKEIMALLDENGIDYNPKSKKEELLKLVVISNVRKH